jgi:hypothetical protein
MNSVLDVIGNREAIAVNQQWSGHPGRLVREWKGEELNMTNSGGYVWGIPCDSRDPTQRGWTFDASKGELRAPSGRCVAHNASAAATLLTLQDCNSSDPSQQFAYGNTSVASSLSFIDASGATYPLPPYAGFSLCLTLFGWEFPTCGDVPSAKMYPCLGDQTAQHWTHNGSVIADACGNCLVERKDPQAPDTSVQLWAKPQPAGGVAVLLINNSPHTQHPEIAFDAATLGATATESSKWKVRDIWERADVGVFSGSFTPKVPAYDSGFYLLSGARNFVADDT